MKAKKWISLVLALGLVGGLAACGGGGDKPTAPANPDEFEPITIRWASQAVPGMWSETVQLEVVDKIYEATEGRITVNYYNNSQLGDANAVFEEVISGSIDMAQITVPEVFDARINAPMLPGLCTSYDQVPAALGPDSWMNEQLTALEAELGVQHLSVSPEGLVGVATNKAVTDPAGIGTEKGVQLRVPPNDAFRLPYEALGFRTSTIPYSELYTSIETGIVDGTGAFDPYGTWAYIGDATKQYYDYRISGEFSQVIMNKELFDSLLPEDQEALLTIFDQYFQDILEGYQVLEEEYLQKMIDDPDWTVVTFTEEEHAAFSQLVMDKVWPELADLYTQEFLDEVKANRGW